MEIATIEFQEKRHSATGASGYHRWRQSACPGSARQIRLYAPPELDIPDEVRDDGIEAHGLAEVLLRAVNKQGKPDVVERARVKAKFSNANGDHKMLRHVQQYVDYVDVVNSAPDSQLWVEEEFNLDWLVKAIDPETGEITEESALYGTSDAIVYSPTEGWMDLVNNVLYPGPVLHVIDLKYGYKHVDAEENPQALYYALGAYAKLRAEGKAVSRVVVHIYMPRAGHGSEPVIETWSCDEAYLEQFAFELKDDYLATVEPDAPLNPDKSYCSLCRARTTCPELARPAYNAASAALAEQQLDPVVELGTLEEFMQDRAAQYRAAGLAKAWADGIESRTRAEMNSGTQYEGLKLVNGVGSRYLVNVEQFMTEFPVADWAELYEEPGLRSAAQIMDALPKLGLSKDEVKRVDETYVRKAKGQPLVALESDKRKAFDPLADVRAEFAEDLASPPASAAVADAPPPPPPMLPAGNLFAPPPALNYTPGKLF